MSMGMPARSNTFSTPIWAVPFAPPPLSTSATFFLCGAFGEIVSCAKHAIMLRNRAVIKNNRFILLKEKASG
jgi:hypothetical protein